MGESKYSNELNSVSILFRVKRGWNEKTEKRVVRIWNKGIEIDGIVVSKKFNCEINGGIVIKRRIRSKNYNLIFFHGKLCYAKMVDDDWRRERKKKKCRAIFILCNLFSSAMDRAYFMTDDTFWSLGVQLHW